MNALSERNLFHKSFQNTSTTMRVAIAGSGALACWIAHYLSTETFHPFIILSRAPKPHLTAKGWQVLVTDYSDGPALIFDLAGVDTVISTISGNAQLALIDAALQAHVRRFAPAEFEGLPSLRPVPDPLDRGRRAALERLQQYQAHGMHYCVFVCGIFYERFAPGGMIASNLGRGSGISGEGDYVMNVRRMKAQIPHGSNGRPAPVCITSVQDVGRFVAAAVGISPWPTELRMCGERTDFSSLVHTAELMRGGPFERTNHNCKTMSTSLHQAQMSQNMQGQLRVIALIASAEGRYDFSDAHLNQLIGIVPRPFQDWLQTAWMGHLQSPTPT